jgi:hypothetical protein
MLIVGVLPVPDLEPDGAYDASQTHPLFSPVVNLSLAEGEKLRLGGSLPPEAFAPAVDASIHGLPLKPPTRSRAMSAFLHSPNSCSLSATIIVNIIFE